MDCRLIALTGINKGAATGVQSISTGLLTVEVVRKGEQLLFKDWADFFLQNYSQPPIREAKTHEANGRAMKHLNDSFSSKPLSDLTSDGIELYLWSRLKQRVRRIRLERGRLYRQLRKLNLLQPYPSSANFLLCEVTRGEAGMVQRHLQDEGILVKAITDRWLRNHLRIAVGRPEDTNLLITSLKKLAQEPYL